VSLSLIESERTVGEQGEHLLVRLHRTQAVVREKRGAGFGDLTANPTARKTKYELEA
jgi:hypothetical protein